MFKVLNYFTLSAIMLTPITLLADPPAGVLGGKIKLEEEVKQDPYAMTQKKAESIFQNIADSLPTLAAGKKIEFPEIAKDERLLSYLSGVYLYCISRSGTCPFILDAILETDILKAAHSDSVTCPTMRGFWKSWIENDFEQRSEFLVQTGDIRAFSRFNERERPAYIKCVGTIRETLKSNPSRTSFLKERYSEGSQTAKSLSKMAKLLKVLREQRKNIFKATGAKK